MVKYGHLNTIERPVVAKKTIRKIVLHCILLWRNGTQSGAEGQKCYRSVLLSYMSVLPRCNTKRAQEMLSKTQPSVRIQACLFPLWLCSITYIWILACELFLKVEGNHIAKHTILSGFSPMRHFLFSKLTKLLSGRH